MPHVEPFSHGELEVPVQIRGRASEPLLFLPGMGVHPRHYETGLDLLATHFTVVTPDLSFASNRRLPADYDGYLDCIDAIAHRFAPGAPRAGHSLGGTLALQGAGPAVALSPLIPLPLGWVRQVWRAVRLQLREYAGIEGARGVKWALAMMANYVGMALTAPGKLFPALACTHGASPEEFRPRSSSTRLVLGEFDHLYRSEEYGHFVETAGLPADAVRWLPLGHDWPVTRPDLMEREVVAALADAPTISGTGPG